MNEIVLTVIVTLLIHSLIGTIIYIVTDNEGIVAYYVIGIVGCLLSGFYYIVRLIKRWKFNHDKRSIFEDKDGNRYYCEVKYANDFCWHYEKMVKRYATKDEWKDLTPFTKEQVEFAQRNCDRCKHDGSCTFDMWRASLDKIKCKHDIYGVVTEFDKFERK